MGELGIGALLARLRQDLGKSQQGIANRYNEVEGRGALTGKEIGRYEREVRIPSEHARRYLAEVFGVDQVLLDRAAAASKARRREAAPLSVPAIKEPGPPPSRRTLAADAVASARFARFLASRNADETAVDQIDADVARLSRHFVSHPLADLHDEIRDLREETFETLRGRQRPRETADLLVAAGRLCGLSAHVCLDVGAYDSAATHARTAWACAEAAGHNGLRAWVRAAESLIAFWSGDPARAADLARLGQQYTAPGSISARLASLEARALAVAGDPRGAATALVTAERARETMRGGDEVPGIFSFPDAKQFTYAGTTHLAIGGDHNVRHAIEAAETAVDLYREAADDDRSTFDLLAARLDLAQGHLFAGDLDAAAVLLGSVLSSPPGQLSASIVTRLGKFASQLGAAKYRGSPQVAALRERMKSTAEHIAAPAADLSEPPT
ncbi:helix-turn-helix domain-containing protein [Streptomyces xinghaiensis]|uniref:helix-turn-helix domain-containing protein n=1 Tax=Streptomyces xinghaiensis TaxID=1038928 RepID=UPI0005950F6E|nr:helix-turn-helix domain-containing protein [Streptomyces xinghaiensis]MZE77299.1 helix-turn-helix domain-containing protein [Streptomyces sp. SID5475]